MKRIALLLPCLLLGHSAFAACEIEIDVGDSLVFSKDEAVVERSREASTVNLTHAGSLPAAIMEHLSAESCFECNESR